MALAAAATLFFLVGPLLILIARAVPAGALWAAWQNSIVVQALALSATTTLLSLFLILLLGTPTAWLLARYDFPGRRIADTLIDLPMVLPPAVAGIALLITFGRRGALGPALASAGLDVPFTTAAVVLAQCFVAAPFYIRAARAGFAGVDTALEQVAGTLGASPPRVFLRVTVPLAWPALLGGAVMAWARALGEFGATIMFAGNFVGRTQTMPLAIYAALESDLDAALTLSVILVAVSFAVLLAVRVVTRRAGVVAVGG